MNATLHADNRAALLRREHARVLIFFVSGGECAVRFSRSALCRRERGRNFGEFALTRNGAVHRFVRREIRHAVDADQMTFTRDDHFTCAKVRALRQSLRETLRRMHAMQPVRDGDRHRCIRRFHMREQSPGDHLCMSHHTRGVGEHRHPCGRHRQRGSRVQRGNGQCIQPITKHRLNRVFPSRVHRKFRPEFIATNRVTFKPLRKLPFAPIIKLGLHARDHLLA